MPSRWISLVFFHSQMTQHTTQKMAPMAANWKTMHQVSAKGMRCVFNPSFPNLHRQISVDQLVSVKSWPRRVSLLNTTKCTLTPCSDVRISNGPGRLLSELYLRAISWMHLLHQQWARRTPLRSAKHRPRGRLQRLHWKETAQYRHF